MGGWCIIPRTRWTCQPRQLELERHREKVSRIKVAKVLCKLLASSCVCRDDL